MNNERKQKREAADCCIGCSELADAANGADELVAALKSATERVEEIFERARRDARAAVVQALEKLPEQLRPEIEDGIFTVEITLTLIEAEDEGLPSIAERVCIDEGLSLAEAQAEAASMIGEEEDATE